MAKRDEAVIAQTLQGREDSGRFTCAQGEWMASSSPFAIRHACLLPKTNLPSSNANRQLQFLSLPPAREVELPGDAQRSGLALHKIFMIVMSIIRKILVSVTVPGPEMAAPILWALGKMRSFYRTKTHVHKIPRLFFGRGGVFWVFFGLGGGESADFIFMGAGIFLTSASATSSSCESTCKT